MLHAFIDESGGRAVTAKSTDYFILAAVVISDTVLAAASEVLASMRSELGRRPGDHLTWKNIKTHTQRVRAAQLLGQAPLTISVVVVCKRHIVGAALPSEDHTYLFSVRLLLERLSWLARDRNDVLEYTLAHITRFKRSSLRLYEAKLRGDTGCHIHRPSIAEPGKIDQPNRLEYLQLADIAASATGKAFEPDRFGNTELRYLREICSRLYRRGSGPNALTTYRLKMLPWDPACQAAHPWIKSL